MNVIAFKGGVGIACGLTASLIHQYFSEKFVVHADANSCRHIDIRDVAACRYHLINHFWLPVANNPAPVQQNDVGNQERVHFGGIPVNADFHVDEPIFDYATDVGMSAVGAASIFHHGYMRRISLNEAIKKSKRILERYREELGSPGMVVGVSIDGRTVWTEGLGYSDFENQVPCHPDTVMRIASIGKALSMTLVARLWESGQLDLDKPIQEYVPDFPQKTYNGEPVTITCRHLVSHLSGVRHYSKTKKDESSNTRKPQNSSDKGTPAAGNTSSSEKYNEFEEKEYNIKEPYSSIAESLKIFKDDPLLGKPGDEYLYTTHGWTLLTAVVEAVTKRKITDCLKDLFRDFELQQTYLDENDPIIYGRSRNYQRDKTGRLKNAPYVDNSYKWASGGLLSTVGDLLKFAHAMLVAYQWRPGHGEPGYLKPETIKTLWTMVDKTKKDQYAENGYGMGWAVVSPRSYGSWCWQQPHVAYHSGGAIGASSVLVIIPRQTFDVEQDRQTSDRRPPQGIVVTIFANLEQASLYKKAVEIAQLFDRVKL